VSHNSRRPVERSVFERLCDLFTKGSHHRNISVILITQNLFYQGRFCRDISLNAKYSVALKNVRDKSQFLYLARQVHPEDSNSLYKSYLDATERPHGYLILDFAQDTEDRLRYRTNVFPDEYPPTYRRRRVMKRIRSFYHTLQVLKTADPKLHKAKLANCKSEILKTLSECSLNLLRRNVKLTPCQKRKLRKHRVLLRKLAYRHVSLSVNKKTIVQRGGFLLPLPDAVLPNIASLIFKPRDSLEKMSRKMYLVSPDYLKTITSNNSVSRLPPPPPKMARKALGAGKKHGGKRRSVKNTKKRKVW